MTEYKYLQSIVNYRIPINKDNTLGNPEIEAKWTKVRGAPIKKKIIKAKKKIITKVANVQEKRSI